MHRIVRGSALLIFAVVPQAAMLAQEPAFWGGRAGVRYEQSPGVYHFVYPCETGLEFSGPAEIKSKLAGSSEKAVCWLVTVVRLKRTGTNLEPSRAVAGRLVISPTRFRFLPNDGKDAEFYMDYSREEVKLQHKPGELVGFFGATMELFYQFAFANICANCMSGTQVPAPKDLKRVDEEFEELPKSLKDFDGVSKRVSDVSSKNRVEIRSENQPDKGDVPEAAHLYSEMNARVAGFCAEPAKSCFQAFSAYEACKSASWDADCGARPKCSEACVMTLIDLRALHAAACVQYNEQAASLVPDWNGSVTNASASNGLATTNGPAKSSRAGYLEVQTVPGPDSPSGVGCSVNASRIRAINAPPSFGVAGMEGLGGAAGGVVGGLFRAGAPTTNGPKKVNISAGVAAGMITKKVVPEYPAVAKAARIQGVVVLQATITKTGEVDQLRVIGGPPLLQGAALDAVKQWQYRPFLVNGEPMEVETTVNVIFSLGESPASAAPAPGKVEP